MCYEVQKSFVAQDIIKLHSCLKMSMCMNAQALKDNNTVCPPASKDVNKLKVGPCLWILDMGTNVT